MLTPRHNDANSTMGLHGVHLHLVQPRATKTLHHACAGFARGQPARPPRWPKFIWSRYPVEFAGLPLTSMGTAVSWQLLLHSKSTIWHRVEYVERGSPP